MIRQRLLVVFLVVLAFVTVQCQEKSAPAPPPAAIESDRPKPPEWARPIRPGSPEVPPVSIDPRLEFIRVRDILASSLLMPCRPTRAEQIESAEVGTGGFTCWNLYEIKLTVRKDTATITTEPSRLTLRPGDCIRWRAVNADNDGKSARVTLINFIDTDAEAAAARKQKSDFPIGCNFCTGATEFCYLYVALDKGTYRYEAKVHLTDSGEKHGDPEIVVACSGPGCGDPTDM